MNIVNEISHHHEFISRLWPRRVICPDVKLNLPTNSDASHTRSHHSSFSNINIESCVSIRKFRTSSRG